MLSPQSHSYYSYRAGLSCSLFQGQISKSLCYPAFLAKGQTRWSDISNLLERLLEPIYYGWAWVAEWEMQGEHQVSRRQQVGLLGDKW